MRTRRETQSIRVGDGWPLAWSVVFSVLSLALVGRLDAALPIETIDRDEPVVFSEEVLPFLQRNCLACHSKTRSKADLVLETPEAMRAGGVSGSALIPGKPEDSLVFLAAAHLESDLEMPPEGNRSNAENLNSTELGLLKLWIEQGAPEDDGLVKDANWEPLPSGFRPIYAVDVSGDGRLAACGRANQIFIYNLRTQRTEARLTNPALIEEGLYDRPGVAHRDLVHSLAWSPDGKYMASGDYRAVHIWERASGALKRSHDFGGGVSLVTATHPTKTYTLGADTHGRLTQFFLESGETRIVETHSRPTTIIEFSANGSHCLTASRDGRIALWDETLEMSDTLFQRAASVGLTWIDNSRFASIGKDNVLRLYTIDSWKLIQKEEISLQEANANPLTLLTRQTEESPSEIYIILKSGAVWRYELDAKKIEPLFDIKKPIAAAAGDLENAEMYFAQRDGRVSCWNIQDRTLVRDWSIDPEREREREYWSAENSFAQTEVAFMDKRLQDFKTSEDAARERLDTAESSLETTRSALAASEKTFETADSEYETARIGITESEQRIRELTARIEKLFSEQKALQARIADASNQDSGSVDREALADVVTQLSDISFERGQLEIELKKAQSKKNTLAKSDPKILENLKKARDDAHEALEVSKRETLIAEEERRLAGDALADAKHDSEEAQAALSEAEAYQSTCARRLTAVPSNRDTQAAPYVTAMEIQGSQLWIASSNGRIQSFDPQTGEDIMSAQTGIAPIFGLSVVDGDRLTLAGADSSIQLWDSQATWKLNRTLDADTVSSAPVDRAYSLAYSRDGQFLAVGGGAPSRTGQLIVYNTENWDVVHQNDEPHTDTIFNLSFSHSGTYLATASADRFVKVLNMDTLEIDNVFEGHTGYVLGVDWARDERTLASSGADGKVVIWNRLENEKERDFQASNKEATAVEFMGYSREAIATGAESIVRLFKEDGKPHLNYEGAKDYIGAAATNWDGSVILVGGQDSVLRVWRDSETQQWATFKAPE